MGVNCDMVNHKKINLRLSLLGLTFAIIIVNHIEISAQQIIEIGDNSTNCLDDPHCINRLHPAIPMIAKAKPGSTIVFHIFDLVIPREKIFDILS